MRSCAGDGFYRLRGVSGVPLDNRVCKVLLREDCLFRGLLTTKYVKTVSRALIEERVASGLLPVEDSGYIVHTIQTIIRILDKGTAIQQVAHQSACLCKQFSAGNETWSGAGTAT